MKAKKSSQLTKPQRSSPNRLEALEAVKVILSYLGEDPERSGLKDTPDRFLRAWEQDWGLSYQIGYRLAQHASILKAQFDDHENYDQMICVKDIKFVSHCEHHLAPFYGTVSIAYIPRRGGRVLGLSKLVRIVELFSHKLQVQERLTNQIADFLVKNIKPVGVGVVIKAVHGCMISRGVKQYETEAVTQALRGQMLTKPEVRQEFLSLTKGK